jgi:hypothetical protein
MPPTARGELFAAMPTAESFWRVQGMSTTSIKGGLLIPALQGIPPEVEDSRAGAGSLHREQSLLEMFALTSWRRLLIETFTFLAVIVILQRWLGAAEIHGLPHPFWLPVLLASCQYGVGGGMIAAFAASVVYLFGISPASAAQDFYDYAATVAVQPATWLATSLVIGGLCNLHFHHAAELASRLSACVRRANDLSDGLEQATREINALEQRIAGDTSSVAALARAISRIDTTDRRAAAASFGEIFRIGAGIGTFTVYLREHDSYVPVSAVRDDTVQSTKTITPLSALQVEGATSAASAVTEDLPSRIWVPIPSADVNPSPSAMIIFDLDPSQDGQQVRRRAEELGRTLANILHACPDPVTGVRP